MRLLQPATAATNRSVNDQNGTSLRRCKYGTQGSCRSGLHAVEGFCIADFASSWSNRLEDSHRSHFRNMISSRNLVANESSMDHADRLNVARAHDADIPFIMNTERIADYHGLVGHWDEDRHRDALIDANYAYFVGRAASQSVGFVIVGNWGSRDRVTFVKRIAVIQPGLGYGRALLVEVINAIFGLTKAHRIWLGVFPENTRARRVYASIGFRAEGIARGSAYFGDEYRDELVMAVLRPDWALHGERMT